jgi:hypothetical protein
MAKKKTSTASTKVATATAAAISDECTYTCNGSQFVLTGGNPPEGTFCPPTLGGCSISGQVISVAPEVIPVDPPLAANSAEYRLNRVTKSLYFRRGSCGKGKHFKPVITTKELAKIDADASELVKSILKNKKISSFTIVLKAQKAETL